MGNAIANNSNVVNTNYAATIRNSLDVSGSIAGFDDLRTPYSATTKTYTVTVAKGFKSQISMDKVVVMDI